MRLEVIPRGEGVHRVELRVSGEPVSWLSIIDLKMRIGSAQILVGGIGGVYTKREHRMKGYARRVIEHAIRWMREHGYPLTALFGIPNFYHKFGYAVFMAEHTLSIMTRDAESATAHFKVEPAGAGEEYSESIARIYNENNALRSGTIVRDPTAWKGFRKGISWEHRPIVYVVKEGDEVVGYVAYDPWQFGDSLSVAEVGAKEHSLRVYETIVAFLARRAIEDRFSRIVFHVPSDHPLTMLCHRYGYVLTSRHPRRADGMARIANLRAFLEGIKGELERRLEVARGVGSTTISIKTDIGELTLAIRENEVEILEASKADYKVELPQSAFVQLVMGYRSVRDLAYDVLKADAKSVKLLEVLFPQGVPYVWHPDRW